MVSTSTNNISNKKLILEEKQKTKSKSTYVNLQKDEDEDRELIALLDGKKSKKINNKFLLIIDNSKYNQHVNLINEVIKEEDEYKNNYTKESASYKKKNEDTRNKNVNYFKFSDDINMFNDDDNNDNTIQAKPLKIHHPFFPKKKRSVSTDKAKYHKYSDLNNITNDTSAYTNSLKKSLPYKTSLQNRTEDTSKFRTGLLSAGGTSNNNILIPLYPMRRPNSNFIFGGEQLWHNFEKGIINNKPKNNNSTEFIENIPDKKIINVKQSNNNINRISNFQMYNQNYKSRNRKNQSNKKKYNTFIGMSMGFIGREKMVNKLHKIKIEKGMMNSGIVSSLNKKYLVYPNRIKQFKNSYLPSVFNSSAKKNQINKTTKFKRNIFRDSKRDNVN